MAIIDKHNAVLGNECSCLCLSWVCGRRSRCKKGLSVRWEKGALYTCQRKCKPSRLGMMEQIWFVNAACSAGCSLTLFQKNRRSLQPKITCSNKEFKPGKFPILTIAIL